MFSKTIKTEAVFMKTIMNDERNINFLQNNPLLIQHTNSSEFFIGQSTSDLVWNCTVIFLLISLHPQKT